MQTQNLNQIISQLPLDEESKLHLAEEYHNILVIIPTCLTPTAPFKKLLHLLIKLDFFSLIDTKEHTFRGGNLRDLDAMNNYSNYSRVSGNFYCINILNTFNATNFLNNIPIDYISDFFNILNSFSNNEQVKSLKDQSTKVYYNVYSVSDWDKQNILKYKDISTENTVKKYITVHTTIPNITYTSDDPGSNYYFNREDIGTKGNSMDILSKSQGDFTATINIYKPYQETKQAQDFFDFICEIGNLSLISDQEECFTLTIPTPYLKSYTTPTKLIRSTLNSLITSLTTALPTKAYSISIREVRSNFPDFANIIFT